jgi:hypothetical protein
VNEQERDNAVAIANQFVFINTELTAVKSLLRNHWKGLKPWEELVQKEYDRLLAEKATRERFDQIQSLFAQASDGDSLIRLLYADIVSKQKA